MKTATNRHESATICRAAFKYGTTDSISWRRTCPTSCLTAHRDFWLGGEFWTAQQNYQRTNLSTVLKYQRFNKIAFQSKTDHPRTGYTDTRFCSCDLDLDLMTSIYKLDLDIPNERSRSIAFAIYHVGQKTAPNYFSNNFVKPCPILTTFSTRVP